MRFFKDGDTLTLEPWRAQAFPVIRDLVVNRSAFDRIIQAGGFISAPTGSAPDANSILVPKEDADTAFDAAACIGCGACVAACPNASAMLFTSAKITHLNSLPQGQPQRDQRTLSMVATMRNELFGSCTNHGECEAVCPKQIPLEFIGKMNRDLIRAVWHRHREPLVIPALSNCHLQRTLTSILMTRLAHCCTRRLMSPYTKRLRHMLKQSRLSTLGCAVRS